MKKEKAIFIAMMLVLTAVGTLTLVSPQVGASVVPGVHTNPVPPGCTMVDFEDGSEAQIILNTIPGLQFTTTYGIDWRYADITTETYNVDPYGTQAYECNGNFFAWLGVTGDTGRIDFTDGTASYFSVLVSTLTGLVVEAYDADDNFLVDSGWASDNTNTGTMTRLTINQPGMAYVIIHDTGNYWILDDLVTDAPGVGGTIDKTISPDEGGLGFDLVHVELDVHVPSGQTAWIADELPPELGYIMGTFMVDGSPEIPYINGNYIGYEITIPGDYLIEFDAKVVEAKSWEEMEVENWAYGYWYDEVYTLVGLKSDMELFTILPFEDLQKYVEWDNYEIPKADVVFSFDMSGSMIPYNAELKSEVNNIISNLEASITDVAFGVVSHSDYPISVTDYCGYSGTYGYPADYWSPGSLADIAFNLDLDITTDASAAIAAITALDELAYVGGDGPQDYTRILYESQSLSWRDGATKILVIIGDAPTHDCDFYDMDVYTTWLYDSTGGDPGPDGAVGGGDDLDFETVVSDLATAGIKVLTIDCLDYTGADPSQIDYDAMGDESFNYMATETGGGYYEISSITEITGAINALIEAEAKAGGIIIPTKTDIHWNLVIEFTNTFGYTLTDVVITDRFGGDIEVDDTISVSHGTVDLSKKKGKTEKQFLTWTIGDLPDGETATLILEISPDVNTGHGNGKKPSGHQEYTSPGWHELNSGATLKFIDEDGTQLSSYTNSIPVFASPLVDTVTVDSQLHYIDDEEPTGENPISSNVALDDGVDYLLMVTGTANAGGALDFDAKWVTDNGWTTWSDDVPGYTSYGPSLLQLHIDGVSVDWGDYNTQHIYYYVVTGDGTEIDLAIRDIHPDNNVGELTVYIMEMP